MFIERNFKMSRSVRVFGLSGLLFSGVLFAGGDLPAALNNLTGTLKGLEGALKGGTVSGSASGEGFDLTPQAISSILINPKDENWSALDKNNQVEMAKKLLTPISDEAQKLLKSMNATINKASGPADYAPFYLEIKGLSDGLNKVIKGQAGLFPSSTEVVKEGVGDEMTRTGLILYDHPQYHSSFKKQLEHSIEDLSKKYDAAKNNYDLKAFYAKAVIIIEQLLCSEPVKAWANFIQRLDKKGDKWRCVPKKSEEYKKFLKDLLDVKFNNINFDDESLTPEALQEQLTKIENFIQEGDVLDEYIYIQEIVIKIFKQRSALREKNTSSPLIPVLTLFADVISPIKW